MHILRIVKLESGGQLLPVIKKKISPEIVLTLKTTLFLIKSTKNIPFYPNHRMLDSYTFALSRIKINTRALIQP